MPDVADDLLMMMVVNGGECEHPRSGKVPESGMSYGGGRAAQAIGFMEQGREALARPVESGGERPGLEISRLHDGRRSSPSPRNEAQDEDEVSRELGSSLRRRIEVESADGVENRDVATAQMLDLLTDAPTGDRRRSTLEKFDVAGEPRQIVELCERSFDRSTDGRGCRRAQICAEHLLGAQRGSRTFVLVPAGVCNDPHLRLDDARILSPDEPTVTTSRDQIVEKRRQGRYPLARPVRIRYRLFQEFIQEMSANISTGGMFVTTKEPREPGSQFEFEFSLEDGFTLIKGRAEVVWIRKDAAAETRPAGMGVRFVELEETSQALIAKIVDKLRQRGLTPFDVESDGAPAAKARPAPPPSASQRRPAESPGPPGRMMAGSPADGRRRFSRLAVLLPSAIGAGLLIVLLFNALVVRPRIEELERRLENLSAVPAGGGTEAAGGSQGRAVAAEGAGGNLEPATPTEGPVVDPRLPLGAVEEWARAWSEQRIDDYLAAYSSNFEPFADLTRGEWEELRRSRILGGSNIRVQVLLAEEVELGPEERIIAFVQAYRSDAYQDRVRKILRLGGRRLEDRRRARRQSAPGLIDSRHHAAA